MTAKTTDAGREANSEMLLLALAELNRLFNRHGEIYTKETIDEIMQNAALTATDLKQTLLRIVRKYPDAVKEIEAMENITDAVYIPAYGVTPALFVSHDGVQTRVRLEEPAPPTPRVQGDLKSRIEAGLNVQNAEAKLWALLTGLECQEVDDFLARADTESYLRLGQAYVSRVKELINKPAKVDRDAVCGGCGVSWPDSHSASCNFGVEQLDRNAVIAAGIEPYLDTVDFKQEGLRALVGANLRAFADYLAKHGIDMEK